MNKIRISIIHSGYLDAPEGATPGNSAFSESGVNDFIDAHIDKICGYLERAGRDAPDIVCTHEDFSHAGILGRDFENPGMYESVVARSCKIIAARLSDIARRYGMLVAANNYETIDGKVYNVSTLYGRKGEIIGKYRKVHLADSENWKTSAGDTFDVFETDIGNIGFYTCYDAIFPEAARILSLNGADIIIHQTQGWSCVGGLITEDVGAAFQRVRAVENSVYLIVAKNIQGGGRDGGRSMVVDNYGCIVAESAVSTEEILSVEIAPDYKMCDPYYFNNFFSGVPYCKARHILARKPWLYGSLTDKAPAALAAFPECRLRYSAEDGAAAMRRWDDLPDDEKKKYHW